MELGLGFLMGVLAGTIVALIAAAIISVSRKALADGRSGSDPAAPREPGAPAAANAAGGGTTDTERRRRSATTMVVEAVESQDVEFAGNIQKVRELLLRLVDIVGRADTASGRAAKAFHAAKDAVDKIESKGSGALAEAQTILLGEIDRIIRGNAALHGELAKARQGIEEQRRQIEELRMQARIDGLTRIPNRTAFDERIREYVGLRERTGLAFTLLLLDVDLFKQVNDRHGHLNGDRILRGVAAKISDSVRNNDFIARYGGEEFAVIFPGTAIKEASAVSERIRSDIAKTNFRLDKHSVKVTVSGGLAECRDDMDGDALIEIADRALYEAKETGRDRIVVRR